MTRISVRPDICHGKPCIQGTRIQVSQVLDLIAAGKTFGEITSDYFPDLTEDDIRACLEFARDLVENEDIHVVEEMPRGGIGRGVPEGHREAGHARCRCVRLAVERSMVLLTNDKDFSNVLRYPPSSHTGIVVLSITAATASSGKHLNLRRCPRSTTRRTATSLWRPAPRASTGPAIAGPDSPPATTTPSTASHSISLSRSSISSAHSPDARLAPRFERIEEELEVGCFLTVDAQVGDTASAAARRYLTTANFCTRQFLISAT
ncbi:MAG: DUF433 domain-containing protein [Acidobacteria bacterium]|nr:DUF433 domain-containing protein [Acidobacteriota bacterium]